MAEIKEEQDKLKSIIERAKQNGYDTEGLFITTLAAYRQQTEQMEQLAEKVRRFGVLIEAKNVKGDQKIITNPAVTEYNKTSTARNGTAATLMKIETQYTKPTERGKLGDFVD